MENLYIYILSVLVSVLFIVFIVATYREVEEMNQHPFHDEKEGGPRAELLNLIGKLIDERIK